MFAGKLDTLVKTRYGYTIVEYKGYMDPKEVKKAPKLSLESPVRLQTIFYSYLLGWLPVWVVYGVKTQNGKEVRTKIFQPSQLHKEEMEKAARGFLLETFCREIWIAKNVPVIEKKPPIMKRLRQNTALIQQAVEWLKEILNELEVAHQGETFNFPKLESIPVQVDNVIEI